MNGDPSEHANITNPFSTRFTRPGAVAFLFTADSSAATILHSLEQQRWWGAIVGPHGSGKSTLLEALLPLLSAHRKVAMTVLHQGERLLPDSLRLTELRPHTQVVVDGYEQLSWWSRWRLQRRCRRAEAGLLVTSHQRVAGLPTLFTTSTNIELARLLAHRLLDGQDVALSDQQIDACFHAAGGNLRETWFRLYDLYELRRQTREAQQEQPGQQGHG